MSLQSSKQAPIPTIHSVCHSEDHLLERKVLRAGVGKIVAASSSRHTHGTGPGTMELCSAQVKRGWGKGTSHQHLQIESTTSWSAEHLIFKLGTTPRRGRGHIRVCLRKHCIYKSDQKLLGMPNQECFTWRTDQKRDWESPYRAPSKFPSQPCTVYVRLKTISWSEQV